jgi:Flp pilus assembly protein TadG
MKALMRRGRSSEGASLIEAAIALPVVLMLLFGVIDGARYVAARNTVNSASHEGARYGSSVGPGPSGNRRFVECDAIRAAALAVTGSSGLDASDITVEYDEGPDTKVFATCAIGTSPDPTTVSEGDRVIVTVTRSFTPISPLIGDLLGPLAITSTSHRSVLSP